MKRIIEPELMEEAAQGIAYGEADFSDPNRQFIDLFTNTFPDFVGRGRVIDLGCGPADILVRFARQFPDCTCLGIDGAEAMLVPGRKRIVAENLSQRIQLSCACLPLSEETVNGDGFQAILSNSLLHHLHQPKILWQTIRDIATVGTPILIMDLMRPESKRAARDIVSNYAGGEPAILQEDFYNSLLAAFRVDEVCTQLADAGLDLHCEAVSDRHLAVWGRLLG